MGERSRRKVSTMTKRHKARINAGRVALATVRKFFPGVTKVNDADSNQHVTVDSKDQKTAKRGDHNDCAMAVAAKRETKSDGVIISRSTAYLVKGKTATRFALPASVAKEVVSFDRSGEFASGEY